MADEQAKDVQEEEKSATRKLIDQKSEQIRGDMREIVRDDLIGVSSWRSSKVGAILGLGIAARAVGSVGNSLVASSGRLSSLFSSLLATEDVPEIQEADPKRRFAASMNLLRKTDRDLAIGIRNTFWSFWLYVSLLSLLGVILGYSFIVWPAKDLIAVGQRVGLVPFLLAMVLKHGYTNWMFRTRSYGSLGAYAMSFDWAPKIKAR